VSGRTERFYQLLVKLQFKFLVAVFICIIMLQLGSTLMRYDYPIYAFGLTLYYGVYVVAVYALSLFKQHKTILDNPELYIPNSKPPRYNENLWQIAISDVLTNKELEILYQWGKGKTWKDLGLHPTTLNRILRKYIHESLKRVDVEENGKKKRCETLLA